MSAAAYEFPTLRLRFACSEPLKYGANAAAQFDDPSWPRFVRITDITEDGRLKEDTFRSLPLEEAAPYLLNDGDVLLARSGSIGRSFIYKPEWGVACHAGYLIRARLSHQFDPKFVYWALNSDTYWAWIEGISIRSTIQNVSAEKYADYALPAPPLETQHRIAQFLDEKTARIDGLIEKKRALLDRLAEKRQALITRAVTKGLNPDAPMKSSGIDWLGDIPAHWDVSPIKRGIVQIEQGWSPSAEARTAALDEWGVLKSGCVNDGVFDESSHKALPAGIDPKPELEVKAGDILMCRASGSLRFIGSVALVSEVRPNLIFSDKTYRISLDSQKADKHYFVYSMAAKHIREQVVLSVSGAEGLANNIAQSSVGSYLHSFPPLLEQKEIAEYLADVINQLECLKALIQKSVHQLDEYRSALITAAVTGQIEGLQ